jgi:hypothetical protein
VSRAWLRGFLEEQNGHDQLSTPGNENRDDETNPIPALESEIREHEESMTYTMFSEQSQSYEIRSGFEV